MDTGAWFALNSRTDENHAAAARFLRRFQKEPVRLYTSDYVIDETLTLLRFKVAHLQAIRFLDFLARSPSISRQVVTSELFDQAVAIFRKYRDKPWSFTDCVSFALMDALDLSRAFAFDHNFTQYGKELYPF